MGHYKSNVRDIEFNLFEVLGLGGLLDAGGYGDLDADTARNILAEGPGSPRGRWPSPSPLRTATRSDSTPNETR